MERNKLEIWVLSITLFFLLIWALIYFTDNPLHGKPKHYCVEMKLEDTTYSGVKLLENESGKHCFESIKLRDDFANGIISKYSYQEEIIYENYNFSQNIYK